MSAISHMSGWYPLLTGPLIPDNLTDSEYLLPPYKGAKKNDRGRAALPGQF